MSSIGTFKTRYWQQIKLQFNAIFKRYRFLFHILLIVALWRLDNLDAVQKDVKAPFAYLMCFSLLQIYAFLLLVIPFARVLKSRWMIWIGFSINFVFWVVLSTNLANLFFEKGTLQTTLGIYIGFFTASILSFLSYYYFLDLFIQQKDFNTYRNKLEQKIVAENKFLKTQINPHFLFNTLNNIYAQSLVQPADAVATIEELKHLLQYMLYDCDNDFVLLSDEIAFLKSYIKLEEIRNKQSKIDLRFKVSGIIAKQKIAPLILVNFIENAFKHGVKSNVDNAFVRIQIYVYDNSFTMMVDNSKPTIEKESSILNIDKGIGIENVQKRLALLYPNRHTLNFSSTAEQYTASLKIKLY